MIIQAGSHLRFSRILLLHLVDELMSSLASCTVFPHVAHGVRPEVACGRLVCSAISDLGVIGLRLWVHFVVVLLGVVGLRLWNRLVVVLLLVSRSQDAGHSICLC